MNKTQKDLLTTAFKYGNVTVKHPINALSNRRGIARRVLEHQGLLEISKQWITEEGEYVTRNRLTQKGHDKVLDMLMRILDEDAMWVFRYDEVMDILKREKRNGKE